MKTLFVAILILAAPASFATSATFQGSSAWTKNWDITIDEKPSFSQLEQLGVEKSAEDNAMQNCASSGATECTIVSSSVAACDYITGAGTPGTGTIECDGQGVARGVTTP